MKKEPKHNPKMASAENYDLDNTNKEEDPQSNTENAMDKTQGINYQQELKNCSDQINNINKELRNKNLNKDLLMKILDRINHWQERTLSLKGKFHQDNEVISVNSNWRRLRSMVESYLLDMEKEKKVDKNIPIDTPKLDDISNPQKQDPHFPTAPIYEMPNQGSQTHNTNELINYITTLIRTSLNNSNTTTGAIPKHNLNTRQKVPHYDQTETSINNDLENIPYQQMNSQLLHPNRFSQIDYPIRRELA